MKFTQRQLYFKDNRNSFEFHQFKMEEGLKRYPSVLRCGACKIVDS